MLVRLVAIGLLSIILSACGTATQPCGQFAFSGAAHTNRGIQMTLNFDFDPPTCAAPACNCGKVAYVQIIRILDIDTGNYLAPNSDQQNRIVTGQSTARLNGWAVDRLAGRNWGYYGRNNDGAFASTLTTGSNATDAILRDTPSGWPDQSWFDAVSVPVCINAAATCVNQLCGFYYWFFLVDGSGDTSDPFDKIAVDWHRDAVDEAVDEWNTDAPGLGKNSFPTFTRM